MIFIILLVSLYAVLAIEITGYMLSLQYGWEPEHKYKPFSWLKFWRDL